ncbi:DUF4405 domain-containing protein [Paenibacillus sp. LMG 31459]|uniref:DUF4405 domain-containing protein n=1 Tax=Paenibacillus phytohabitans TaxID=2654978 RepID=A0ABX1YC59_9BACL|nr:DUF4405 domain-containing protein [Paenibacillus phytohabitans]NOU77495.1 DUF4405 domain-containing protein [Paenibacillus phytohabitans]
MKPKTIVRLSIDTIMTVLFLFMMAYQWTGNLAHEILGTSLLILFILHNVLNLNWYKTITKGRYPLIRVIRTVINLLLLLCMLGMMISALVISKTIFSFLGVIDIPYAQELHSLSAYWGFVIMAVHLGMHWVMVMGAARRMMKKRKPSKIRSTAIRSIGILIAVYGIYVFFKRDVGHNLILYYSYSFWNYDEPALYFFLDYLALMGLFVCITHYVMKRIQAKPKLK